MKILHLSNVAGRLGGGVSEVVHALLYYQNKSNYNSNLWFMGSENLINEIHEDTKIDKKKLSSIPSIFGIKNSISPSFFFKRNCVSKNYHVIHQHGIFLPISIFNMSLKNNIKKIISPHGYLEYDKLQVSKIKKKIAFLLFEKYNLKNCDCLVACSDQEAASLREWGLTQPIVVLPNGINDNFLVNRILKHKPSIFKVKNNINLDSKLLLFLSRVHPWKGLKLLLESILTIKDYFRKKNWIFIIAGPDELNHTKELSLYVKNNKIDDIVRFVGPLYNQDKISAIDSADCSILPTKGENFGISIIESLARGIPVITTKKTPWNDLEKNNCGWWIERSKDEMIKVLLELIKKDSKSLMKMGKSGIGLIKKQYLWSKISDQSIHMYKWIINDFDKKFKYGFKLYD